MTFRLRTNARLEFAEAILHYEDAEPGRGLLFEAKVKSVIDEIVRHPRRFPIENGDLRCADVLPYPFCIYYRIVKGEVIIVAIYHQSRDPDGWRGR